MASPKALILQGILGVAGLCASSAAGVGLSLDKAFGGVQSDAPADDSSILPKPAEIIEVKENSDLGIPKECEGSCSLSAEKLKNLKFEQKGDEKITFEGLDENDEFELLIEVTEDLTNYPKGKKYSLKPKTTTGTVTIKGIKEGDIVLESGKEVLIRETSSGGKLEHLLEEVNGLGIPKRCEADQATHACNLTQHQLQKLKFETGNGSPISVDGLDEGNIVTLKIEDKKDDRNNYPKGKKYVLRSATGDVTIKGIKEGDIVLESGKEVLIRETSSGGKLEHLIEEIDRLGIPRRCEADKVTGGTKTKCDLKQKQLKDLKFEAKEGSSISVEGQNENSKFTLEIEDKPNDTENYPKGKKYTLKSTGTRATIKGVKGWDIHIWENQFVVIRETREGGKLERAPEEVNYLGIPESCTPGKTCTLTEHQIKNLKFETKDDEEITVEGIKEAKTVSLSVEDKSNDLKNYPKGKKYILSGASKTVTIKGLKDGDIEIGTNEGVVIREKETGGKLEKAPEEIDHLWIPERCNSGITCHLTKEELQRIKFETNGASSISIDGLDDGNTVDLKVETTNELTHYPKKKKYTFTSKSGTVTIQNTKDRNIVLEENKSVVFRETKAGNKLETYLDVLGIPRGWEAEEVKEGSETKTYHLSSDKLKDLKFENFNEKTGEVKVTGLNRGDDIKLTISWDGDTSKYPDNRRFSFDNTEKDENIKISKGDQEITIGKNKETRFKNEGGKLELVEAKTKSQIAIEEKIGEKRKILKELGLEKLQIGNFTGDTRNPTKHEQTNVEIKSESELKKIKFKALGGGADSVTSLGNRSIRVYLEWAEDESKFPKNMKFSFENQLFSLGFEFRKGYTTIKIEQKTQATMNTKNTFKVEKDKGKWYLVRVNN